jgi:hypothetical protein
MSRGRMLNPYIRMAFSDVNDAETTMTKGIRQKKATAPFKL